MTSAPASYPRCESSSARCPRNIRRNGAGIRLPPCSQVTRNASVGTMRHQRSSGSWRNILQEPGYVIRHAPRFQVSQSPLLARFPVYTLFASEHSGRRHRPHECKRPMRVHRPPAVASETAGTSSPSACVPLLLLQLFGALSLVVRLAGSRLVLLAARHRVGLGLRRRLGRSPAWRRRRWRRGAGASVAPRLRRRLHWCRRGLRRRTCLRWRPRLRRRAARRRRRTLGRSSAAAAAVAHRSASRSPRFAACGG